MTPMPLRSPPPTADARPSVRIVLLKFWDARGFCFYTNLDSRKGAELAANPRVHMDFHWKSQRRQVRVDGRAELVPDGEADAYFASRAARIADRRLGVDPVAAAARSCHL